MHVKIWVQFNLMSWNLASIFWLVCYVLLGGLLKICFIIYIMSYHIVNVSYLVIDGYFSTIVCA